MLTKLPQAPQQPDLRILAQRSTVTADSGLDSQQSGKRTHQVRPAQRDEPLGGRTRITATGVLTIVAYQFVASEQLPRVAYLTLLDKIMVISFALLAVTVLESLLVSRKPAGSPEAHAIDRRSRWLFPLAYALLLAVVVLTSG